METRYRNNTYNKLLELFREKNTIGIKITSTNNTSNYSEYFLTIDETVKVIEALQRIVENGNMTEEKV